MISLENILFSKDKVQQFKKKNVYLNMSQLKHISLWKTA